MHGNEAQWRNSIFKLFRPTSFKRNPSIKSGRLIAATALAGSLGMAMIGGSANAIAATTDGPADLTAVAAQRSESADIATRSSADRSVDPLDLKPADQELAEKALAATKQADTKKNDTKKADAKKADAKKNAKVAPVAGLSQTQMDNASTIVRVGQEMKLPKRAMEIAIATAMQESNLYNLSSDVWPESKKYDHQGSGNDHDSIGLFQQRPTSGWGSVKQIMQPEYSAKAFYSALRDVPGYDKMPLTAAAQTVQVSAFPDHYAKHENRAKQVVSALTR